MIRPFNTKNIPIYARASGIFSATVADLYNFESQRFLTFNKLNTKYANVNGNFYFVTYNLVNHVLAGIPHCERKPDIVGLKKFMSKNPKAGDIRLKGRTSNEYDIFEHPSTRFNFARTATDPDTDETKTAYIQFLNTWNVKFLPAEIRQFCILFPRGKIVLNYQRSQYQRPRISSLCRFCIKNNIADAQPEDVRHIFSNCPLVQPLITRYFEFLRPDLGYNNDFLYIGAPSCDLSEFLNIEILLFSSYILNCLRSTGRPSFAGLTNMTKTIKIAMCAQSIKYSFWLRNADLRYGNGYALINHD